MLKNIEEVHKQLGVYNNVYSRSHWQRGVASYTWELLDNVQSNDKPVETWADLRAQMLNGAQDWSEYSYGGCSLIYDCDICEMLATPSEQKRKKGGELPPNSRESWLDVQARALRAACLRVRSAWYLTIKEN